MFAFVLILFLSLCPNPGQAQPIHTSQCPFVVDDCSAEVSLSYPYGEFLEGIAIDQQKNMYLTLFITGRVVKVDPRGRQTVVADFGFDGGFATTGTIGEIATDRKGNAYFPVNIFSQPQSSGVWRVNRQGQLEFIAPIPGGGNGITIDGHETIYVTSSADPAQNRIYSIDGKGNVQVFSEAPGLEGRDLGSRINGLQFFRGNLYAAMSGEIGKIIEVSGPHSESPGHAQLHATVQQGFDDFAMDVSGAIYVTTHPGNSLIYIDSRGHSQTLLDAQGGMIGPTAAAFGRGRERNILYVVTDGGLTGVQFGIPTPTADAQVLRIPMAIAGATH